MRTILEKFRDSIRRGTGKAVLIMRQHPRMDFSKEIIRAADRVYAYDPQCEGSRGYYLSQIIDLSPKKEAILDKILNILSQKKENNYDLYQLFNIARIYAQRGNHRARQIMYKQFSRNLGSETELLDLDGLQALKFIAHVKGKILARNKNAWEDDWLIEYVQREIPNCDPMRFLRQEAKKDPYIKKYLAEIKRNVKVRKKYKKPQYSYKSVKALIMDKKRFGPYIGKRLKRVDLSKLAADLIAETDPQIIPFYLTVFGKTKFLLHYRYLLQYAFSLNAEIREKAIKALSLFANKEIRAFALNKISSSIHPEQYLTLFVLNFKPADSRLILGIIRKIKNKDVFHNAGSDVLDIYEHNKTKTCRFPLLDLYQRSICGICRESAVRILQKNGVLPKKLKKEIKYDSFVEPPHGA